MTTPGLARMDARSATRRAASARRVPARSSWWDRLVRAVTISLAMGLVVGPLALPGAVAAPCSVMAPDDWVTITVPAFSDGDQVITHYAVSPTNPRLLHVTNGRTVQSSTDGGCSFRETFSLASANLSYDTRRAQIKDLALGSDDARRVYLAVEAWERTREPLPVERDLIARARVVVTNDGGSTWREGDGGLGDAFGSPLSIAAAPGTNTAYLLVDEAEIREEVAAPVPGVPPTQVRIFRPQRLFASGDGGSSWAQRWQPGGDAGLGETGVQPVTNRNENLFKAVVADPGDADVVVLFGPRGFRYSNDGGQGAVFTQLDDTPIAAVEMRRDPGDPATSLLVFPDGDRRVFFAPGVIAVPGIAPPFQPLEVHGFMGSGALARVERLESGALAVRFAAATLEGDVYYYFLAEALEPKDISAPGKQILDLQASREGGADIIYGRTDRTLQRRVRPDPPPPPEPPKPGEVPQAPPREPVKIPSNLAHLEEPALLPESQEVVLAPGETRALEYTLVLPETRKVDIAFLVDATSTMADHINGLVGSMERIITELVDAGIHAHFGVAYFRSFETDDPYRRLCDIIPPGPELGACLDRLNAVGGQHKETQLAAMYQAATGEGQWDGSGRQLIAPGQGMSFRDDALSAVVIGTDENFTVGPPHPTFTDTAAALNRVRARQIGLAYEADQDIFFDASDPPGPDLRAMARATGAFAPAEGVDCNGNGDNDISGGQPLVCEIPPGEEELEDNIGNAIIATVMALMDMRRVELEPSGDTGAVEDVRPDIYPAIDFAEPQALLFDVVVTCPLLSGTAAHDVDLDALTRGVSIATADLRVTCQAVPRADREGPRAAALPLVPPPPRIPHFANPLQPIHNPVTQAQAQMQAQSQAQAQAGLITQRQQQPQVAAVKVMKPQTNLAHAGGSGEDLQFSSYKSRKRSDLPPYLASYVIAACIGAAFGLATRVRTVRAAVRLRPGPRR